MSAAVLTINQSYADHNILGEKNLKYLIRKNERRDNQVFCAS